MSLALLVDLTLRGSLVFVALLLADRTLGENVTAPWRRVWWLLVPLAFLLPLRLTPAGLTQPPPTPDTTAFGDHVFIGVAALKSPWTSLPAGGWAQPGFSWIGLVWLVGVAISALSILIPTWRAQRKWSAQRLSTDPLLLTELEDAKQIAGVTAPMGLIVSDEITAPALLGWLRPRILLPTKLACGSRADLQAVLLHELAHFKCLDIPLNWLFAAVRAAHWFNPLAWLAISAWSRFREEAADETAVGWMKEPTAYGEALLHTLQNCSGGSTPCGALAIGESVHNLKRRILMIRKYPAKTNRAFASVLVILLLGTLATLAPILADESPDEDKKIAVAAMEPWLGKMDARDFPGTWDAAAASFRNAVTKDKWVAMSGAVRTPLGKLISRKLDTTLFESGQLSAGLNGTFVVAQFATSFENLKSARETVTFEKEADGQWREAGYYIKPS